MTIRVLFALIGAASLGMCPQVLDAAVGRTAGSFAVTPTGAASYSIPIFAPPGPRGMQPNISLVYSSRAGIGPLGRGWSIAGLSAITRCGKTTAQDTNAAAVSLAVSDGYCKDGNRLRLTGGTYGLAGSTYQTELADFSQTTAFGSAGNGPSYFVVKGKDGLTYEYGNTTDSRVLATGSSTASTWMLNLITDRAGNRIKFTYKSPDAGTTGTTIPLYIDWTATSAGSSTFAFRMSFNYGNNTPPSSESGYQAGTVVLNDDLLTSVSVSDSGTVRRLYSLGYGTSGTTGAYRLQTVTECSNAAGTDCLAPTTIAYQDGSPGIQTTPSTSIPGYFPAIRTQYDFNGDGIDDLAYGQQLVPGSPHGLEHHLHGHQWRGERHAQPEHDAGLREMPAHAADHRAGQQQPARAHGCWL
jgi:Salmonella virulence plasmid 65kDa B protein